MLALLRSRGGGGGRKLALLRSHREGGHACIARRGGGGGHRLALPRLGKGQPLGVILCALVTAFSCCQVTRLIIQCGRRVCDVGVQYAPLPLSLRTHVKRE
jgi:hypothetical protein